RLLGDVRAGAHEAIFRAGRDEKLDAFAGQRQDRAPPHSGAATIDDRLAAFDPQIHSCSCQLVRAQPGYLTATSAAIRRACLAGSRRPSTIRCWWCPWSTCLERRKA